MKWIYTDGAPFICSTAGTRKQWRGTQGSSTGAAVTDYERACNESDYLARIACGSSQVLVLGDEPAQAAFVAAPTGLVIARWIACESLAEAHAMLAELPSDLPHLQAAVQFTVNASELWMLDASATGSDLNGICAVTPIEPGTYNVTTERFETVGSFEFLIHRWLRASSFNEDGGFSTRLGGRSGTAR
jgi:hypothetical protein